MDPKLILNTIEGKIGNYSANKVVDNYKAENRLDPINIATRDVIATMASQYQNILDKTLNGKSNSAGGVGAQYDKISVTPQMSSGLNVEPAKPYLTIQTNYK